MKSAKLLTILSIGIAIWAHSCVKKKTTGEKITAEKCKAERKKFNETNKKCVPPDEAFCQSIGFAFDSANSACIASTNPTDPGSGNDNRDSSISFAWTEHNPRPVANGLFSVGTTPNIAGTVSLRTGSDLHDIRVWLLKVNDSTCDINSNTEGDKLVIVAKANTGTTECKLKISAVNHKTGKYNVSDTFVINFQ